MRPRCLLPLFNKWKYDTKVKSLRQVKSDFTGTKVPRFWMEALLSAEEIFFEEWTDAEDLGGDDAEGDNY